MADQVKASHILLMYKGSSRSTATRTKDQARQEIDEIKQQLDAGGDFGALAQKHSDCPSSRKGGDLGAFGRGQMVKEFDATAFGLAVGGTSDVIETPFGFHIIRRMG
jgi:peptidyl-prolyl cis-trans isomerase C